MLTKFISFNPKTKERLPIWIDVSKILWLTSMDIEGQVKTKGGTEKGTVIHLGTGMLVILGEPSEVLKHVAVEG